MVYNSFVSASYPTNLRGVFAAAVTPLNDDYAPDLTAVPLLLDFLANRGCHGALLLGTTGEGPSLSPEQRLSILQSAVEVRQSHPGFLLLAGTGNPSLEETIFLTRQAYDLGLDGAVILPPYYFRGVRDEGLFSWFATIFKKAVPKDGRLLAYHIPPLTGIPFSLELFARLKESFPVQFTGLKDSSGDPQFARDLGERFGSDLAIFSGNDRLFSLALGQGASGCITAPANLISPLLRKLWDSFEKGSPSKKIQDEITAARDVLERYQPAPALMKGLLARCFGFPRWPVCPPLLPFPNKVEEEVLSLLQLA